jgi:hypothetical protein
MAKSDIESRVDALEREVQELRAAVIKPQPEKDWRRTVGMFGDDPVMRRIMKNALQYREDNRKAAKRSRSKAKRRKL